MKNIVNFVIAFTILFNQVYLNPSRIQTIASSGANRDTATVLLDETPLPGGDLDLATPTIDPSFTQTVEPTQTETPTAEVTTGALQTVTPEPSSTTAAYPAPVTPEVSATATQEPSLTPSLTPTQTATPTPTLEITPTPDEYSTDNTTQFTLSVNGRYYQPGSPVELQWKIKPVRGLARHGDWRIQVDLPDGWQMGKESQGTFDEKTQQLALAPKSTAGQIAMVSNAESGDETLKAYLYEGETLIEETTLVLRSRTTAKIDAKGGEVTGKAGKTKVKVAFPGGALMAESSITIQSPEEEPSSLPRNGKHAFELISEDSQGNRFHQFNGKVQLEIAYDPEEIGIHPSALSLFWYNEETAEWEPVDSWVDEERNVLIAYTDHFSLYAFGDNSWLTPKIPALDAAQTAEFTGSATYSYGIDTQAGPGGMKPAVSLDYNSMSVEGFNYNYISGNNSNEGTQPSFVGLGWTLNSGGMISRDRGENLDNENDDTFSLVIGNSALRLVQYSGEIASSPNNYIEYKPVNENFWKIRRYRATSSKSIGTGISIPTEEDWWVVWDTTGTRYTLKGNLYFWEKTHACLPEESSWTGRIFRPWGWQLDEIKYPSGMLLKYTYDYDVENKRVEGCNNDAEVPTRIAIYPKEITYKGSNNEDLHQKVVFSLEDRYDYSYRWSHPRQQVMYEKRRLSSIQIVVQDKIYREYKLNYFQDANNPLFPNSLWKPYGEENKLMPGSKRVTALQSISLYGKGGVSGGQKLPDVNFGYSNMFLTEVNNGQGGKVNFMYETIDPNAENGKGRPFVAEDSLDDPKFDHMYIISYEDSNGNPQDRKNLSPGSNYNLPFVTADGPIWPGQGYRVSCQLSSRGSDAKTIQLGITTKRFDTGASPTTYYSPQMINMPASSNATYYSSYVVIPNNSEPKLLIPAIFNNLDGHVEESITVDTCKLRPVLTHYRVTSRTVTDTISNSAYTYSYSYQGAAANDTAHSLNAQWSENVRSESSKPYREFRGHSMVSVTEPNGLRVDTYYYQDDINKGRAHDIKQYSDNNLLSWTKNSLIYQHIFPAQDIYDTTFCAWEVRDGSGNKLCLQDQDVFWYTTSEEEVRQYGLGTTDENTTSFVGMKKVYSYAGIDKFGNLTDMAEQTWNGSGWVNVRQTHTGYAPNFTEGGVDSLKNLVGLPGSIALYQCPNGNCDYVQGNLLHYECNIYGEQSPCHIDFGNPTEQLDSVDLARQTGKRTLIQSGSSPTYSDELYQYDTWGNRTEVTRYRSDGYNSSLADSNAETTTTCFGIFDGNNCVNDGIQAFPALVTDAAGHKTAWEYDYQIGLPVKETGPNGEVTKAEYDAFGRMSTLVRPGDDNQNPTMKFLYHDYEGSGSPYWVSAYQKTEKGMTRVTRKMYDGLGRIIQSQQANEQLGSTIKDVVTDTGYDFAGKVVRQSVPVELDVLSTGVAVYRSQPGAPATLTQYDRLGRPVTVTATDQTTTTYAYSLDLSQYRLQTTTTDAKGNATVQYQDALGRLSQVVPSTGPGVTYQYNAADLLTSATYGGATTSIAYNLAGWKTQQVDPDMGTWNYGYDAIGNLKSQSDERGCKTTLSYDALNRLTGKSFETNCSQTASISYTYDSGSGGIGQRTGMSDGTGSTAWEYDLRGRIIHETKTVVDQGSGLGTYHSYWSYNPDDTVRQVVYPNQETVNYAYLPQGALSQVYTIEPRPDSNYTQYYSDESTYDAAGRVKTRSLGDQNFNITYEYYAWDASHGQGRLRSQVTTRLTDNAEIQNLRYENQSGSVGYDAVGNLMEMTEWRNGLFQTQSYQYDGLNRLTHASAANPAYSEEYTYDATTGNLSSKGGVSYTYGSSHPHAVTGLNGQQLYAYDANGNMTSRTVNGVTYTLSYDGENHLTALSGGGLSARYGYDGDGKRVLAVIGSTRTVYIGDYFEAEIGAGINSVSAPTLANHNPTCDEAWCKRNYLTIVSNPTPKNPGAISPLSGNYGATRYHTHPWTPPAGVQWRTYYYAGTQRIAQRTWSSSGSTLNFLLSDHLGSTRQVIDADGNRVEDIQYKAWGETLAQTGSDATRRKYTGQIESEAGLYFYNARYYDPALSRFAQADTLVPNPGDPQTWDRYAYINNNPVNGTDPTGHFAWLPVLTIGGALIGAGINYGTQVYNNYQGNGGDVGAALTQNVNLASVGESALAGAAIGFSVGVAAPVVVGLAGEALAGAGVLTGSTSLFSAGVSVSEFSGVVGAAIYGVTKTPYPKLEIDSKRMPNISGNIKDAQSKGAPSILTRTTDPARITANRNAACAGFCGSGSPDEYPFASTFEGGSGAFVKGVPLNEQRIQGGVIKNFYQKYNIGDGDKFRVVPK